MKKVADYLYKSSINYFTATQFLILVGIFSYYFVENFILSEAWEVLTLRSIDDYAMQDSVRSMQKALLSGNWTRVFGFYDYAYGNAFWLFNSILLLPLYFINDAQTLIVVGRQLSLFFVFGSIYVISLIIDQLKPCIGSLKYPILIALATMPMTSIISTKLHVNAQSIFFGILSFYLLVRTEEINKRLIFISALFAGVAIGFKLTGLFLIPLLGFTVLDKLRKRGMKEAIIGATTYIFVAVVIAAICTVPLLLLFPFYINELGSTYKIFLLFKNMQNIEIPFSADLIVNSFAFYFSPVVLTSITVLFALLVFDDIKNRRFISSYLLGSIASTVMLVLWVTHKGPLYIATYFVSLAFFIPIGFLGICTLSFVPHRLGTVLVYCLVVAGLFHGAEYRTAILTNHKTGILGADSFFAMAKTEVVKRQLLALKEIKKLVYPLAVPIRILQDSSSIFPATRFIEGIEVAINYGDLKEKSTWGDFDYILLNSDTYYGKRLNSVRLTNDLEEETRKTLRNTGNFYGRNYTLIYTGYDALLYKLDKK